MTERMNFVAVVNGGILLAYNDQKFKGAWCSNSSAIDELNSIE